MNERSTPPSGEPPASSLPPSSAPPPANLEFKAAMLLLLMVLLICGTAIYLMYARGAFDVTQKLVLLADDSEGVVVGMDVTFSGFPIGRIRRIELSKEGKARMIVDVSQQDAHWLRRSSIFTLERGLVGNARIRAFSGIPTDPPLEDGATRTLLVGDVGAEIPRLVASAKELIQNLSALTATDSSLDTSLRNVKTVTAKLNGPNGMLGALVGNEKDAQKMIATLDRANALLTSLDGLAAKADSRVFGPRGVMNDAQAAIVQMSGLLNDVRSSLKKVDAVLVETQAVGANLKEVTTDLGPLRADVESNLRKVEQLVNEINRKWPFARDTELKLP
ncbi:MAG TPA: mammalian cell entry protein [Oxalobacteraceae bacterium]|nr:mammalian cell entry protein [Oxalobacteraceae bacterium]